MYHNSCGAFFGKEEGHVLELGTGGYRMRLKRQGSCWKRQELSAHDKHNGLHELPGHYFVG